MIVNNVSLYYDQDLTQFAYKIDRLNTEADAVLSDSLVYQLDTNCGDLSDRYASVPKELRKIVITDEGKDLTFFYTYCAYANSTTEIGFLNTVRDALLALWEWLLRGLDWLREKLGNWMLPFVAIILIFVLYAKGKGKRYKSTMGNRKASGTKRRSRRSKSTR